MRKFVIILILSILMMLLISSIHVACSETTEQSKYILSVSAQSTRAGNNTQPILRWENVYPDEGSMTFEVYYTDLDGDDGTVYLYLDDDPPIEMVAGDNDPTGEQYYYLSLPESEIYDDTEYYFSADDNNGSTYILKYLNVQPFLVGDYAGWGEQPVLSNPSVYLDDDDWVYVFNVTYSDPDGDVAEEVHLNLVDDYIEEMYSDDTDPSIGQNFIAYIDADDVNDYTEFYLYAMDVNGSSIYFYDTNGENFLVGKLLSADDPRNGDSKNGDPDDSAESGGWGFSLPEGWGDPEVIVAIVALLAMGIGSAVGLWLKKKKRKRFSNLLSKIDDVYGSYKTHPRKCESELEKIKAEVDDDLKKSVIDENNYSILKERISEITQEIRQEAMRSKVQDLPKDMELRIKDMLIDGKISRKEYTKFMKVLKGSDLASKDKIQMEKLMAEWVKEDEKKIKK